MTPPVTIVIPVLEPGPLVETALDSLAPEIARRDSGDEVVIVDDSGSGAVAAVIPAGLAGLRVVELPANVGFARALAAGVHAARHEFVFAMNSDVRVRAGFLEPLVDVLERPGGERVFAAVPRILLGGEPGRVESLVALRLERGIARAAQPLVEGTLAGWEGEARLAAEYDVAFPIGGACLFRRARFDALGGFDPAIEPFYLEDLDLGWRAWRAGFATRYVGRSVVEHRHRGTIGSRVPPEVVLAAIERNRLLFTWKHLDDARSREEHVRALARRIAEARVAGDRAFLTAVCLALEDRASVRRAGGEASGAMPPAPSFEELARATDPF